MAYGPTSLRCLRFASLALMSTLIVACSGGGGGGDSGGGGGGGSTATVTISGRITFDRVPFKAPPLLGLNFAGIIESPAREVVVEAVQPSNVFGGEVIVATTMTNTAGDYALQVPANTTVFIRAKAQMLKTGAAPTWNFRVLNNTNNDALYALDGASASSGSQNSTRNLRATSGWGTNGYLSDAARVAAPFAILDTIYHVKSLILSARADSTFPALDLFWSTRNRSGSGSSTSIFCPDNGDIISSLYVTFAQNETDQCSSPTLGRSGIYILGEFQQGQGDTDEFDQHVIAHEAGHYFEDQFSRTDSIGGEHSLLNRLDLRVAFGEGWGNAFGAMALNAPAYRDSAGANAETAFDFEAGQVTAPGWFSEFSVSKVLWDLFDAANEPGVDDVALGFQPIYDVMTTTQPSTNALTAIFPLVRALKVNNPAEAQDIDSLLALSGISAVNDDFGSAETNSAGSANVLPIYAPLVLNGGAVRVCGATNFGTYNKLSNRRFLRFNLPQSATVTIDVAAEQGTDTRTPDPDIEIWEGGAQVGFADNIGAMDTITRVLMAGTYVVEVYECSHIADNSYCLGSASNTTLARGTTCMNVSATGS